MIALDTNVLVRFLVEDDAQQTRVVKKFLKKALRAHQSFFISDVVLCEVVWVLRSSYKLSRTARIQVLHTLLRAEHLTFTVRERVLRALEAYEGGLGDFADYLIREHAREAGCDDVVTFDEDLHEEETFIAPQ